MFLCKLSSRRQLDCQLHTDGPALLDNLNRLAGTQQDSRPVNQTLHYFLGRSGTPAVAGLRTKMLYRLIRMKARDDARLQGRFGVPTDGTGYLVFRERHCDHCLTRRCGERTLYMHQVLEAQVCGPGGTVFSIATEFIDNRDLADTPAEASAERRKQDCELKALRRLARQLRQDYPPLRLGISGDGLYACGTGFQIAKDHRLAYVYTFQEGGLLALWADFQGLLQLCPQQRVELLTPVQVRQVYRWVNGLAYTDSHGRF